MTSKIHGTPDSESARIDYGAILEKYPWLVEKNRDCILSPDSDGFLCGLLMSSLLGWKIRGFYDGKMLLVEQGVNARECVFLDMEIFRRDVRSIGQHMIHFNNAKRPPHWDELNQCISANELRSFDMKRFPEKYPLATVHLLLGLVSSRHAVSIPTSAICPLLYTDGTFKNLFNYPENCIQWLHFLHADDPTSPLHAIFFNSHYSISNLMLALNDFFTSLRTIAGGKRGADKLKLPLAQDTGGFDEATREQIEKFLKFLAGLTGWSYNPAQWTWNTFTVAHFAKGIIVPGLGRYTELMQKRPLSLAITSALTLEYTLDEEGKF